jgi:PEGA domain-containing protein
VRILLSISALLVLTACGALSHGTSQKVTCVTAPEGASVRSASGATCSTPCTVNLKRKKDDVLTIEMEGYETVTLPVHSALSGASAGNILLPGGLICWGVDLVSGGGYHLVPERVALTLKPLAEKSSLVTATATKFSVSKSFTPNLEEEPN